MGKHLHIVGLGLQSALTYRVNFFFRSVFNLIPLAATIVLWHAIFAGKESGSVAGYTLAQMVTYYLVVTLVETFTSVTEDDWQIASEIKDGHISQFLLKPLDYLKYRFCLFTAGRLIYTTAAIGPVILFVILQWKYLLPPPDLLTLVCFLFSIAMSAMLQFLMSFTIAMLAFWVVEISTFVFILLAFERMASGQMFPLDILPASIQHVVLATPFAYQIFFPVSIYMGRVSGPALVQGLLFQACWVAIGYTLARAVWNRGVKSYAAVGG